MSEEQTPTLREKLSEEVGRAAWKDLRPHAVRGQLIFVDASLTLLDVAVAVAEDQSAEVQAWVGSGLLRKLDEGELERGDADNPWHEFVIVQPFVLARPIELNQELH